MIKILLAIFLLALFYAKLEAEAEGAFGWAENFPTTRTVNWFIKLLIGKEITGYHLNMLIIMAIIFHCYFIFFDWNLSAELISDGLFSFYLVLEDFLFFVVNKHFGLFKFKKRFIDWHKRWFLYLPVSYWTGLIASGLLLYLGYKLK